MKLLLSILSLIYVTNVFAGSIEIDKPHFGIKHGDLVIGIKNVSDGDSVQVNNVYHVVDEGAIKLRKNSSAQFQIVYKEEEVLIQVPMIPSWMSILPPLIAIVLALILKEVIVSLVLGIYVGSAVIGVYTEGMVGLLTGFLRVIDTYIIKSLIDPSHISVIVFSVVIGGIVSLISRNGGMQGVVNRIIRFANSTKSAMLTTFAFGVGIFFDDYANSLVVGNTMRPVTDKMRVSREKLAYIVDSTAAPVAAIAFVTTWIGAELGYISSGLDKINTDTTVIDEGVYSIFMNSLAYSFYPVLTLFFIILLIVKGRDFGPMLKYERKARKEGVKNTAINSDMEGDTREFEPIKPEKSRAFNAVIPILTIIVGTMLGLIYTGFQSIGDLIEPEKIKSWGEIWSKMALMENNPDSFFEKIGTLIGASDPYASLLWASFAALAVTLVLTLFQKIMKVGQAMSSVTFGFKTMIPAVLILILAWSLAEITDVMQASTFITQSIGDGLSSKMIPAITFVLGAFIAFSTGSSWSTMALLYPLILPTCWEITQLEGLALNESMPIFYACTASVIAGSVLGDHCSPISDTTILSSLATSCNHINHVRTQMPYALTVGAVALIVGVIPASFGWSPLILFPLSLLILYLIVHFAGKKV